MTQVDTPTDRAVEGRLVTITGGTGSFGSIMAKHLLEQGARQVHIFSRDEAKQDLMRRAFNDERMRFFLGDVRDADSIRPAVTGADFVFHAAALKQVPSCEFFPQQAVKTNVVGSHNVIEASAAAGVKSLVLLSTDKAVYPVNAMGMSKALMEKTAQAYAQQPRLPHDRVGDPLRQRHVLARIRDPGLHRPAQVRSAVDPHRTPHDAVPDVPRASRWISSSTPSCTPTPVTSSSRRPRPPRWTSRPAPWPASSATTSPTYV
ncbi:polysaccharide biosynthesis protein [Nocardioides sp. B-3]|uniref:polysaccharide biosynthesis protein n=1 Tax=Nocardioides sp. B-3 TaxID=2895565 RepID=UPI002342DB60|nr:polysaccharide biosynthesis protein [Nocardioides sp. B-3]